MSIRRLSLEEFAAAKSEWNALLARSTANALFMSWEWQWLWWRYNAPESAELAIVAGYASNGTLVGIAPLYRYRASYRGLRALRLEVIGSRRRGEARVFSEYLDIIAERGCEDDFLRGLAEYLQGDDLWDELVFCNTPANGLAARLADERLGASCYVRLDDALTGHVASLPGDFEEYVRSLDASTRRRVWNHRKRLSEPTLHDFAPEQAHEALDRIDSFHSQRWGRPHYVGTRRAFHAEFIAAMGQRDAIRISELRSGDRAISIMYDVRIGDCEYNIQSGFEPVQGISPSYLHFGYCIERACAEGVRSFDFLAGTGLHRDYKRDFGTTPVDLITLQSVRSRPLAWLYRGYDQLLRPTMVSGTMVAPLVSDYTSI